MGWGTDFLQGAAQQGLGAGMGLLLGRGNDRRQFKQATKLGHLELGLNKLQTDYNMKKQMEMWEATNYKAQMEQLKKAGLNPGLIYGMGGAGGATTNVETGNINTGQAAGHSGEAVSMANTAAQLGLMRAQKENIEADTANKQADTTNKPLQGENIKASTSKLIQETDNAKVQKELMEIQIGIDSVKEHVMTKTQNLQVSQIMKTVEIAQETLNGLVRDNEINDAVKNERMNIVRAELIQIGLENALLNAQKTNTQQQTTESKQRVIMMGAEMTKWINEIMQGWTKLDLEGKRVKLESLVQKMAVERGYDWVGHTKRTYDEKKLLRTIDEIMREE